MTTHRTLLPNGISVFSRQDGPSNGPVFLILHGFPTSSFQYRNVIPLIASAGYRVIAPDLPGFGFTTIPSSLNYQYTFVNLATTTQQFLDALNINTFALYINDYGAPTGLRLALNKSNKITAIVSQNGNAYESGLSAFWDPLKMLWNTQPGSTEEAQLNAAITDAVLTHDATKGQYVDGEPNPDAIDPASWTVDWALMHHTPGNFAVQLGLFRDYANNVKMYPEFQKWFKESNVPILAVWGKNDTIFPPAGAEPFGKANERSKVELWDGGHFLGAVQYEKMGKRVVEFLKEIV